MHSLLQPNIEIENDGEAYFLDIAPENASDANPLDHSPSITESFNCDFKTSRVKVFAHSAGDHESFLRQLTHCKIDKLKHVN